MVTFEELNKVDTYPGIFETGNAYIEGECYQVSSDTLERLDILEEEGTCYLRKDIELDKNVAAQAYISIELTRNTVKRHTFYNTKTSVYTYEVPKSALVD